MREVLSSPRRGFRDFNILLSLFTLLLLVMLLELALAWPYGHVMHLRMFTGVLPLGLWQLMTTFGDARWPLAIALLLVLPDRRLLLVYLIALLFGWLAVRGLKQWFLVPRPGLLLPMLDPSLSSHEATSRNSFPSSHTMVVFSFFGVMATYFPFRKTWPVLAMAFLVAVSRIGIGAHWPVDILGGGLVGIVAAVMAVGLWHRVRFPLPTPVMVGLILVVAAVVATMPWIDAGYPQTQALRLAGALVGIVAAVHAAVILRRAGNRMAIQAEV